MVYFGYRRNGNGDEMKKAILAIVVVVMVAGCAGREANLEAEIKPGDANLTCEQISAERTRIRSKVAKLIPETDKTGANAALGVSGFFLAGVPWLFMDLSKAEQQEIQAYRDRDSHLEVLAIKKKCDF